MTVLMRVKFGSHLYGTSTPASDIDFKSVVLPPARDILLQRIVGITNDTPQKAQGEKNKPGDVDDERFALHKYLSLLAEGQTVALDMLFAPRWSMVCDPHPLWNEIVEQRHRLVSRRAASFVGYCRTQANKYGIKGSRVHAAREIVAWFDAAIEQHGHLARLSDAEESLRSRIAVGDLTHTDIIMIEQPGQGRTIPHLECCNRKTPFFNSLKDARAIYARILAEYGARALLAEKNEGVDWKALSHAVRVGREALEFLETSWITFPLSYAPHILAIKQGKLPYAAVADEIEALLLQVEQAQATSCLPEAPDAAFIDELVCSAYGEAVRAS
jgi:hypothetical protein